MAELSIKIRIGNREYPMKVKAEDEERIRRAGRILHEKIKSYREQFGIDDNQDLLAMVAFDALIERMKMEETSSGADDQVMHQIDRIHQLLTDRI
jgi:cell division protein ZapA